MSLKDDGMWDFDDVWRELVEEYKETQKDKSSAKDVDTLKKDEHTYSAAEVKEIIRNTIAKEYNFHNTIEKNVYDKARHNIELKYKKKLSLDCAKYDRLEVLRDLELSEIQEYETASKKNLITKISCGFKAFKKILTEEHLIVIVVLVVVLAIPIVNLLYNIDSFNTFKDVACLFAKSISSSAFSLCVPMLACFLYNLLKRRKTSRVLYASLVMSLVVGSFHVPFILGLGTTQIGDYYELEEYTEYYYVQMSRSPQTNADRKVYTLPAEIQRTPDSYTVSKDSHNSITGEPEYREYERTVLNYHINYLYFSNGGYLYFGNNEPEENTVVLNKEIKIQDYHDETFYITLTANKADVSSIAIRATANKGSE